MWIYSAIRASDNHLEYSTASSLGQWVSTEDQGFQTTFSRLKTAWGKAVKESFQGYGDWESVWIENDQVLEFARHGKKDPQRLKMVDFKELVRDIVHRLPVSLEELLPAGVELPDSQVHKLGASSIHREEEFFMDSPNCTGIMHPLYQDFARGHSSTVAASPSSTTTWFRKEQEFLGHLFAALLISGGVSPRTNSAQNCRIRGVDRNIFHVLDSPVWVSSQFKANSAARSVGGLWAFPPQVAWPLYFYLGVVRPFSINLLQSTGYKPTLDIQRDYLFVHTSTSKCTQRLWAREEAKRVLEKFIATPLGLKIDTYDLRQILQAVANRQLGLPKCTSTQAHDNQ
jgi:hypothetical protein